jgi:hypothetical protein
MFFLGLNCKIKENNHLGLVSIFILFSSLLLTTTTFTPSASAFINPNLLGLSPNMPGTIAPTSPQIGSPYQGYGGGFGGGYGGQSFGTGLTGLLPQVLGLGTGYSIGPGYGGGFGGFGGGYGGQSFGTGLIGLLPQVLGGIGSLFGQDYGSGYGLGGGYGYDSGYGTGFQPRGDPGLSGLLGGGIGSLFGQDYGSGYGLGGGYGYDSGYGTGNDQGFSEFETNNDPFDLGYGSNEAQDYGLDNSESYSNTPVEDLRALDSPAGDPFFSGGGDDFSESPFGDLFGG